MRADSQGSRFGFSLVELLVVIAIIAIMATLVAPTLGVLQGNALTRGGDLVAQTLSRARERAVTLNRRVEARFYKYIPPDEPGAVVSYRALQLFEIDDLGNAKPIDRIQSLPQGILINSNPGVSPLLDTSRNLTFLTNQPSIPKVGTSYTASYVQFRPNGSTDLDPTKEWVVTLHRASAGASPSTPPANFYAIEIDPISAAIRTHRP